MELIEYKIRDLSTPLSYSIVETYSNIFHLLIYDVVTIFWKRERLSR